MVWRINKNICYVGERIHALSQMLDKQFIFGWNWFIASHLILWGPTGALIPEKLLKCFQCEACSVLRIKFAFITGRRRFYGVNIVAMSRFLVERLLAAAAAAAAENSVNFYRLLTRLRCCKFRRLRQLMPIDIYRGRNFTSLFVLLRFKLQIK